MMKTELSLKNEVVFGYDDFKSLPESELSNSFTLLFKIGLLNKISSKMLMLLNSIFLKCVQNKQSFILIFAVLK